MLPVYKIPDPLEIDPIKNDCAYSKNTILMLVIFFEQGWSLQGNCVLEIGKFMWTEMFKETQGLGISCNTGIARRRRSIF